MLDKFYKLLNINIISSIIYILIGILMIINPTNFLSFINYLIAISSIIIGVIFLYFTIKYSGFIFRLDTCITGIAFFILGIILLKNKDAVATILPIVLAIIFIIESLTQIEFSWRIRNISESPWLSILILGILSCIFGLIIGLSDPLQTSSIFTIVAACFVIAEGIIFLVDVIQIKRHTKSIEKYFKQIED